jgi:hypothetical protein
MAADPDTLTDGQLVERAMLAKPGNGFVLSVAGKFGAYGRLTARQRAVLVDIARETAQADNTQQSGRQEAYADAFDAMRKAQSNGVQQPKIELGDGYAVSLAPDGGALFVRHEGEYVGAIKANGTERPQASAYSRRLFDAGAKLVAAFGMAPESFAASYGHATSRCCFCRRELTDGRSVEVGYGPVCADRYGLVWGGTHN